MWSQEPVHTSRSDSQSAEEMPSLWADSVINGTCAQRGSVQDSFTGTARLRRNKQEQLSVQTQVSSVMTYQGISREHSRTENSTNPSGDFVTVRFLPLLRFLSLFVCRAVFIWVRNCNQQKHPLNIAASVTMKLNFHDTHGHQTFKQNISRAPNPQGGWQLPGYERHMTSRTTKHPVSFKHLCTCVQ